MPLDRSKYYSQTECIRYLKVSVKRFKKLVEENDIKYETVKIETYYTIYAKYFLKEDIEKLKDKII